MTADVHPRRVAYLINQYPKVSHSFIRREIQALERLGLLVSRFAVRGWLGEALPDASDREEQHSTRYLLRGAGALPAALFRCLVASPGRLISTTRLAFRLARGSERPLWIHLVYLAQAARLREWMRVDGITHLHAHFGTNSAEVALLAHGLGGPPFSFTVHGPEEFDKPAALHLADKVAHAAFVIAVSSFGRSQLLRWVSHRDWPKVAVVRCGVDRSFAPAATPCPDVAVLVCVGRICEQKGQLLLVEATAALIAEGTRMELVLVGDGDMRKDVEALARRLGVAHHVRITGWASGDAVRREMLGARALVLPSFAEGLPVVLMEAMALGRPVISTYIAGIPELVVDGENGWLVPAADSVALQGAMRASLRLPTEELDAMGRKGRARVLAMHDADREAVRLSALIRGQP